ncbi:hypothetical protein GA0070616_4497 [Micromonospora nigra]|uniref:Uncharacterized protein n=1 Tax=Micromonospora nigra TaxID=145857 RepID=A0A1C6SSK9_9ACTN|nr:hypothetical protein [Micromonospora nigra]SCL32566.1 hypothetical protein GA0070616_4497 [Micromonospora nigra]
MPPPSDPAGRPPRPVPGLLAAAERHLRVDTPAGSAAATTRSHLGDGRCVGWYGPPTVGWQVAVDAEHADAPVPEALARRFGPADFWPRWTRTECLCKLADVPVVVWWRRHGLGIPPGTVAVWRTLRVADLVVTVAFAPTRPGRRADDEPFPRGASKSARRWPAAVRESPARSLSS